MPSRRLKRWLSRALVAGAVLTAAFGAHAVVRVGGPGVDALFALGVYNAVLALAVVVIVVRGAVVRAERWAWLGLGLGLGAWALANTYYSLFIADLDPVPIPSVADGLWLGF